MASINGPSLSGDNGPSPLQRLIQQQQTAAADSIKAELLARLGAPLAPQNTTTNNQGADPTMAYKFKIGDRVQSTQETPQPLIGTITLMPDKNLEAPGYYQMLREDGGGFWNTLAANTTSMETAKKVEFDSVVLEDEKKQQIHDAISQMDNHDKIFKEWGFAEVFEKGTAISLLFYGLPGTGKTLMAQAIADKYGKKLVMVSTAEIETPEPGGAERNLKKYFTDAEKHGDVLLLDECDSLITDRARVGMILAAQINALLTCLENHKGIVVFTTNRLGTLDPAFDRRVSLKLEFNMPDAKHRELIWKRMFPVKCPLAKDIDWAGLSEVEIAGGHIKNVVLRAARRAAAAKLDEITDAILWEALEKEVESLAAYQKALEENNQRYGTPIANAGAGMSRQTVRKVALSRAPSKLEVDRG